MNVTNASLLEAMRAEAGKTQEVLRAGFAKVAEALKPTAGSDAVAVSSEEGVLILAEDSKTIDNQES